MTSDDNGSEPNEGTSISELGLTEVVVKAQLSEVTKEALGQLENAKAAAEDAREQAKQLLAILESAKATFQEVSGIGTNVAGVNATVKAQHVAITATAGQIDAAQKHAEEVRGELDGVLSTAKRLATEAEASKLASETAKSSADIALAAIQQANISATAEAKAVADALATSKLASQKLKGLADKSETIEKRISDYESQLAELEQASRTQLEAITALLPGAASAGLASAFNQRRQTFLKPGMYWTILFVSSVLVLAIIAAFGLGETYWHPAQITNQQLLTRWLSRLPVAAALVWLAMHASRESALAKRLEEDYGFKASVAASFQGFQEQMSKIGATAAGNEPLTKLCDATLMEITNHPGRIYEKHALTVSPTMELLKAAHGVVEAAKAIKLPDLR